MISYNAAYARYYSVLVFLAFCISFYFLFLDSKNRDTPEGIRLYSFQEVILRIWFISACIFIYGLVIAGLKNYSIFESAVYISRLIPIVFFPVPAFAIKTEKQWVTILLFMAATGLFSCLYDLATISFNPSTVIRLMDLEYNTIFYFFSLLISLLLLTLYDLKTHIKLLLISGLPFLFWRTFISLSRGEAIIIGLVIGYCVLIKLHVTFADKKKSNFFFEGDCQNSRRCSSLHICYSRIL